jgi:hypothetical protein
MTRASAPAQGADRAEPAAAAMGPGARMRAAIWRPRAAEHLAVLGLGLLVLAVHDVGYMLRYPFWTDESWVAMSTRFPLSQLPATTSSTPIGWSALARLVTVSGEQTARLLPLAFAGAAVVVAYWFARRLGWHQSAASVAAGLAAGLGVLLVPAMLTRNDLKQYTADACMALVALAVTSRLEREWSRRWLAGLSVATWGGMLVSHTVAFVGAAAFAAVCVVQVARCAWRRLGEAALAGAGTAVLMLVVYKEFDARAVLPGLTYSPHFRHYYLSASGGVHEAFAFIRGHFDAVHGSFGLGPAWLAVPLFVAGIVAIFRLGRPATAIAAAGLWPEMLAISALHKYPFLDRRTSTFLFAFTVVVAAIGLVWLCSLLRPRLAGVPAAVLLTVAALAFAVGAKPFVRGHTIPNEDVRDQASYVAAHAAPGDVIVVNLNSNWSFAYYWPVGRPARRADSAVLQEYEAYFPGQPRIVIARNRNRDGVDAAVAQAVARRHSCTPIWLVRAHVTAAEQRYWTAALSEHGLLAKPVGRAGLSIVRASGARCQ